jgi:hypothetical protein
MREMRTPGLVFLSVLLSCSGCKHAGNVQSASSDKVETKTVSSAQNHYLVSYATCPAPIPLNEPFSIDVVILNINDRTPVGNGITLEVDGRMPHHRHGMNRQPTVTGKGNGEFHIENMLFHMPGRWELYFDIVRDGRTERAQDVIFLD